MTAPQPRRPAAGDGLPPLPPWALPAILVVLALAGAAVFPFDARVMDAVRALHEAAPPAWIVWRRAVPVLLFFANGGFLIPAALGLYAAGRVLRDSVLRHTGAALSLALVTGGISSQLLKHLLGRVRPNFGGHGEFIGPNLAHGPDSFPSGHATDAFVVAWALWRLHPRLGWVALPIAALVAFQRVEGVKHFPSDVAAGAILGICVAELVLRRLAPRPPAA